MLTTSFLACSKAILRDAIILFLVCLTTLFTCDSQAESPELTAMTFNIRWDGLDQGINSWENRKVGIVNLIQNYAPDIIALQEASRRQTQYLQSSLPGYQSFISKHERAEYLAILLDTKRFTLLDGGSFWLVESSNLPGGTRRAAWVQLRQIGSGRDVYVYNVHLDGRSPEAQERSVLNLMSEIHDRSPIMPFFVTGDFNAVETSPTISYIKGDVPLRGPAGELHLNPLPLVDAVRKVLPAAPSLGTAHGFGGGLDGPRIDYVFVSDGFIVRNARVVHDKNNGRYPSDHFPVVVDLALRM